MFRTALRNVLAHKGRLLMTALAVMLGTAFVAGTMVFSDTLGKAMSNSYAKSFSDVSVQVTHYGAGSDRSSRSGKADVKLTDATIKDISALPGAERVRGIVSGFTAVADKNGNRIGESWDTRGGNYVPDASGKDPRYPIAEGRGPQSTGEIALDKETAAKGGYKVGDSVRIAGKGPVQKSTLTGIFTTDDPDVSSGATLALMDTVSAQKFLLTPGQFSGIAVTAKPGVSQDALLAEVKAKLPDTNPFESRTQQQLTAEQETMIASGTSAMKTMLLVFAAISLFVGIFIIANTFTMLIAQRTKELALLRAVGASRRQVTNSVLVEALLIGATASVAGLISGIGIGAGMQALIRALTPAMPTGPLVIAPLTVVVALVVGVLVTVLSAVLPAVRASRIAPVAAMSSGDQPATQKSLVIRNIIGSVIAGGGVALVAMGAASGDSSGRVPVGAGAALALIGVFILLPLLSRPVIALVGPLLAKLAGTPGKLARQNAVRNPRRTAATAAALTIGLTLVSALTVLGASVGDAVDKAVTSAMRADYSIGMANGNRMSAEVASQVASAAGVAASSPVYDSDLVLPNSRYSPAKGLDAAVFDQLIRPTLDAGSTDALAKGQILIDTDVAKADKLTVGAGVEVEYADGTKGTVTVGGIFKRNEMLAPVLMANADLLKHDDQATIREVLVKGKDGATSALQQGIKDATGQNPVIDVKSKQDIRDEFSKIITFALNMMYGLLAMSVLVAILGVINTLAMSVFERKREIGMLRAIGLDRGGIKRMVRLESVVISLFGAAIGVALGCFVAWAVNGTLKSSITGLATVIPYDKMAIFLALAGLVGLVAAIWPARRASRLDILESIKTD
ncbi:ABC transporter permease [Kitasatospora sp. NPDC050543]|uniref:ABC transporter permease n=1 Tax=Kitasatospora sp. NPDC050543 TaxID=3364054 RepID=UPI00378A4C8A